MEQTDYTLKNRITFLIQSYMIEDHTICIWSSLNISFAFFSFTQIFSSWFHSLTMLKNSCFTKKARFLNLTKRMYFNSSVEFSSHCFTFFYREKKCCKSSCKKNIEITFKFYRLYVCILIFMYRVLRVACI